MLVRWRVKFHFIDWQASTMWWFYCKIDFKGWWSHWTWLYSKLSSKIPSKIERGSSTQQDNHLVEFCRKLFLCVKWFHWNNNQATVHPFTLYKNDINNGSLLKCRSLCIISNEKNHDAHKAHAFITKIIQHTKQIIPNLIKMH